MRPTSPVPDLAHDVQDRVVGCLLEFANQLREEARPLADDVLQVTGDLAAQRQQHVRILVEFLRKPNRRGFGRRRNLAALDLAQVPRLNADSPGDLAQRIASVVLL